MPCIDMRPTGRRLSHRLLARGRRIAAIASTALALASCMPLEPLRERPPAKPSDAAPPSATAPRVTLPPVAPPAPAAAPATDWAQYRLQAAQRIVAANASRAYLGQPPEVLLAIPVLEIEVDRDGSVKRIVVLRHPRQARDTTQLAIDAVRRAAPFGDVSRLPRPWRFTETFLFDDGRRFKPRSLD